MMNKNKRWNEAPFVATLATFALCAMAGCATTSEEAAAPPEPKWAANGYLSPSPTAEPEIIGLFVKRDDCEEAVAGWLSRQVVGNPVSGECLPIDHE